MPSVVASQMVGGHCAVAAVMLVVGILASSSVAPTAAAPLFPITPPHPRPGHSARLGASRYNGTAAVAWVESMGCQNKSISACPGGRLCTDAEYYSRALAAGGVIRLDPNTPEQQPYLNYTGKYNLCLSTGLFEFLRVAAKWQRMHPSDPAAWTSPGAIGFTVPWYPGMPFFVFGAGRKCESHTPIVANGPHCAMNCSDFAPRMIFAPRQQ